MTLIGVEELAEWLGVPIQTIYDWRLSGRAPRAHKIGKHMRFALSDVEAWLEERHEGAGGCLMARWRRGQSDVETLIASGELQKLTGDAANGDRLLEKAAVTTPSSSPSAPSSDPVFASSAPCAGDVTSSSTPSVPVTMPRTRRHPRPSSMPPRIVKAAQGLLDQLGLF